MLLAAWCWVLHDALRFLLVGEVWSNTFRVDDEHLVFSTALQGYLAAAAAAVVLIVP